MGRDKPAVQIIIADSNVLFRRGLSGILSAQSEFKVRGETCDARETLACVCEAAPDVLVMDLALIEAEPEHMRVALRQADPSMAILFLTREDTAEHLQIATSAGARGYMLKDSTPAEFTEAVRQVASSSDDSNPRGLSKMLPDLQALAKSNEGYTRGSPLTAREQEVVKLLAEGRTVREVASELFLSIKTVEAHKLNLMRKLDIHNRASLVQYAMQAGILAEPVAR